MIPLLDPPPLNPTDGVGANDDSATVGAAVRAELWISFVSLLRSHLGALQTSGKLSQAVFAQLTHSSVEIADLSRTLHLSLQSNTGEGEWSLTRLREMIGAGRWLLSADARVTIDGGEHEDMELAVEAFARKLWSRAAQDKTAQEKTVKRLQG
jgi:hypothetical protein